MGTCIASDIVVASEKTTTAPTTILACFPLCIDALTREWRRNLSVSSLKFETYKISWLRKKTISDSQTHTRRERERENVYTRIQRKRSWRDDVGWFVRFLFLMHCFNTLHQKKKREKWFWGFFTSQNLIWVENYILNFFSLVQHTEKLLFTHLEILVFFFLFRCILNFKSTLHIVWFSTPC